MSSCKEPVSVPTEESTERKSRVFAKTISVKRLSKRKLEIWRHEANEELKGLEFTRPNTRAECLQGENAQRPCPFVSCKHHLYLEVNERSGAIKINFPHLQVWELPESCALDVADRGGATLEETGKLTNRTRERIRQVETMAFDKLKALDELCALHDDYELTDEPRRPDLHQTPRMLGRADVRGVVDRICGETNHKQNHNAAMARGSTLESWLARGAREGS